MNPELSPEAVKRLKARGWSEERIKAAAARNNLTMPKGFIQRTGEGIVEGARTIGKGIQTIGQEVKAGVRQGGLGGAARAFEGVVGGGAKAAGGVVEAVASPINEGIVSATQALTTDKFRQGAVEVIGEGAQAIAQSEFGQAVAREYARMKQEAPGAMAGVEGVANIALNAPVVKAGASAVKLGLSATKKVAGDVAEKGLASAAKDFATKAEDRTLRWVGIPQGGEAGTKKSGVAALEEAGRSERKVIKTGFFGTTRQESNTALKEQAERIRVFGNTFDDVGSDIDKAAKGIVGKVDEIDNARVGSLAKADLAMNDGQRTANMRYFSSKAGEFKTNILAGTENLALGQGEPTAEKLADFLFDRIKTKLDASGGKDVLKNVDEAISDFVKGAKKQFGEAVFAPTERGKSAAKQALDAIRANARQEVARAAGGVKGGKEFAEQYTKLAKDERIALSAYDDFLNRYSKKFGKSQLKEGLGKVSTMQNLIAIGGSAAFVTGAYTLFPQIVGAVAALGIAGTLAYYGVTRPQLRRVVSGAIKSMTDKLPSTTGPQRRELLEQIAIGAGLAATLELSEEGEEGVSSERKLQDDKIES